MPRTTPSQHRALPQTPSLAAHLQLHPLYHLRMSSHHGCMGAQRQQHAHIIDQKPCHHAVDLVCNQDFRSHIDPCRCRCRNCHCHDCCKHCARRQAPLRHDKQRMPWQLLFWQQMALDATSAAPAGPEHPQHIQRHLQDRLQPSRAVAEWDGLEKVHMSWLQRDSRPHGLHIEP